MYATLGANLSRYAMPSLGVACPFLGSDFWVGLVLPGSLLRRLGVLAGSLCGCGAGRWCCSGVVIGLGAGGGCMSVERSGGCFRAGECRLPSANNEFGASSQLRLSCATSAGLRSSDACWKWCRVIGPRCSANRCGH